MGLFLQTTTKLVIDVKSCYCGYILVKYQLRIFGPDYDFCNICGFGFGFC